MKKAAWRDNGAEPEHSAWGGRCCSINRRRCFHEPALNGGSGPHTAFISPSMEKVNSEDAHTHTHTCTYTHRAQCSTTGRRKKNKGAEVMMRVIVWTRQLLQEVMTGTWNNAHQACVFCITSAWKKSLPAAWSDFGAAGSENLDVPSI